MNATFPQISPDKNPEEKDGLWLPILITFTVLFLGIVYYKIVGVFTLRELLALIPLGIGAPRFIRKSLPDWVRKKDIVGTLNFEDTQITWETEDQQNKLLYADISQLLLHHNYIRGKSYGSRDILHNGIARLTVPPLNGRSQTVQFLIASEDQHTDLITVLKFLYRLGIPIKEAMGNYSIKSKLLDVDLNYQKIQTYKQELNNGRI